MAKRFETTSDADVPPVADPAPPAAVPPAVVPPAVENGPWQSLTEFCGECDRVPSTALAGFRASVTGRKFDYRRNWRKILTAWLAKEGYAAFV